ncbi:MAG: EAL domain-containing protein [Leptospiraceae bacterium]|nr:EAL domain-containing protein [Leptospiraceae bacterium]MCP5500414.1 EAL domain-containing protein [Leptospiraceae bacterium]
MKKILVIEDQDDVRDNICAILGFEGFECMGGANGREGIENALKFRPDLIICDIMMPEMDGYEVLDAVRKNPELGNIPFIFVTARTTINDIRYGMSIGADDYLTKPFSANDLISSINTRLERHKNLSAKYEEQLQKTEKQLLQVSYHDSTSGFPNQFLLKKDLDSIILGQNKNEPVSLILFLMSKLYYSSFDTENDTREVIHLIMNAVKDKLGLRGISIYHLEKSLFAMILKGDHARLYEEIARTLIDFSHAPFQYKNIEISLYANVGIAIRSYNEDSASLIKNARIALEETGKKGSREYSIYNYNIEDKIRNEIILENKLFHAVENEEFILHYQPRINIQKKVIEGMEALIRWNSPDTGLVPPNIFIPALEETGLIVSVGKWVLYNSILQTKKWEEKGYGKLKVSVNVSVLQILNTEFDLTVKELLHTTGFSPSQLELEITETNLMADVNRSIDILRKLKSLGVSLAMDDFGTGYSSLAYLKDFPLDCIKIDKRFIDDVDTDPRNRAIVKAIHSMSNSLQMNVVAEGVETREQLNILEKINIDQVQGYFFSKPLNIVSFEQFLKDSSIPGNKK